MCLVYQLQFAGTSNNDDMVGETLPMGGNSQDTSSDFKKIKTLIYRVYPVADFLVYFKSDCYQDFFQFNSDLSSR